MPYSLTKRQREVLTYLREYIRKNESYPRENEIAEHFSCTLPTAHNYLEALQRKGYLYFKRDSHSGFFIRLAERVGLPETVLEIPVAGKVDHLGEVLDFSQELGSFPAVLIGAKPEEVFALVLLEDLPQASLRTNDFLIFDMRKKPQGGDICLAPMGNRLFLIKIQGKSEDGRNPCGDGDPAKDTTWDYPIPAHLLKPYMEKDLVWTTLALGEGNRGELTQIAKEQRWTDLPLKPDWIFATALRLVRALAF